MQTDIMLVGNSHYTLSYAASLIGMGYRVNELRTVDAARIMLRSGEHPRAVVIDMKHGADLDFVRFIREQGLEMPVIVIGATLQEGEAAQHSGATAFFHRPLNDVRALIDAMQAA